MENKKIYLLSTCDEWKSSASARAVGIYDESVLKKKICQLYDENSIDWDGVSSNDTQQQVVADYLGECNEESYIKSLTTVIKERFDSIHAQIFAASPQEIHDRANYIMVEQYILNQD